MKKQKKIEKITELEMAITMTGGREVIAFTKESWNEFVLKINEIIDRLNNETH